MTEKCIFCEIISGRIPSYKIHEDDLFIAILDRFPVSRGHTLVIPKFHVPDMFGLCEKEAPAIMPLAVKIAGRIKDKMNPSGFNILQNNGKSAGQVVFHYHLHIIPRYDGDGISIHPKPMGDVGEDELLRVSQLLSI